MNIYTFILKNIHIRDIMIQQNLCGRRIIMSIIFSNISNEKFTVCCVGKTVYVYEKSGRELKRFIFDGALFAAVSPNGDMFAVKSQNGTIGLYSFEKLEQVGIAGSSEPVSEDEQGMCFSSDGGSIYSIEHGGNIAVYDMNGGKTAGYTFDDAAVTQIECGEDITVLGKSGDGFFAAKLEDGKLADIKSVSEDEYNMCFIVKCAELRGFSSAAMEHYMPDARGTEDFSSPVGRLYKKEL